MDQNPPEFNLPLQQPAGPEPGSPGPVRRGSTCPRCGAAKLDYNGLLELECDNCGYILREGAGCS